MSFRLSSRARRDIARADAWWQENRPEAHNAVLDEIAHALEIPLNPAYSRLRLGRDELARTVKRLQARRGAR